MGWFRTRWICALALCALTLQFAVSFAHIHPEDLLGHPRVTSAAAPDDDGAARDPDGVCDICIALALLATAPLATPPVIARVVTPAQRIGYAPRSLEAFAETRIAFRSRAPPA